MNLLRNDPALLNDEAVLKHFMAANNCDNPAFEKELSNEFDYPKMAAFYRAKAPEILKTAPATLHVMLKGFYIGQYDSAKGAFPFVDTSGRKKPTTLSSIQPVNDLEDCGLAG